MMRPSVLSAAFRVLASFGQAEVGHHHALVGDAAAGGQAQAHPPDRPHDGVGVVDDALVVDVGLDEAAVDADGHVVHLAVQHGQ
jgi:hypothetical protein